MRVQHATHLGDSLKPSFNFGCYKTYYQFDVMHWSTSSKYVCGSENLAKVRRNFNQAWDLWNLSLLFTAADATSNAIPLMFRQILHYTPASHPDHDDVVTSQMKPAVCQFCEWSCLRRECSEDIVHQNMLCLRRAKAIFWISRHHQRGKGASLYSWGGHVSQDQKWRKLTAYLFNDILLLAQQSRVIKNTEYRYGVSPSHNNLLGWLLAIYWNNWLFMILHGKTWFGMIDPCVFHIHVDPDAWSQSKPAFALKRKWVSAIESCGHRAVPQALRLSVLGHLSEQWKYSSSRANRADETSKTWYLCRSFSWWWPKCTF
jgi:hypothetical protein